MLDIIKTITEAKAAKNNRTPYFPKDTRGVASIVQLTKKETQNSGTALFPEFRIDEVKASRPGVDVAGQVGLRVGNPFFIEKYKFNAPKDAKALLLAAFGMNDDEVNAEDFAETLGSALSSEQPLRGIKVAFETYQKKTEKGEITLVRFSHLAGQTAESVKANRASLDTDYPVAK